MVWAFAYYSIRVNVENRGGRIVSKYRVRTAVFFLNT